MMHGGPPFAAARATYLLLVGGFFDVKSPLTLNASLISSASARGPSRPRPSPRLGLS
jgi:hypothetical protein